jgi:acetyl esterase
MPLDPQAQAFLAQFPPMPDFDSIPLEVLRAGFAQGALSPGEPERIAHVENRKIPGPNGEIGVRIYRPDARPKQPVLVYFHGGGFVLCDLDTHDGTCRSLANGAGCTVVSVDYRLAPEHRFPAAPEDCYAATRWVAERGASELGVDTSRLAIGGDSAGGNLTAVVAQMARDRRGPKLAYQLLIYPVTDARFDTPSYRDNAEGYFLTTSAMKWFWKQYLADAAEADNPYASPLRAKDLGGLPPGLCITAEFDPLRDEGEAYAAKLRKAGVPVATSRYDGMFHGFFGMGALLDKGKQAVAEAAAGLKKALG